MSNSKDSIFRTFLVAFLTCAICSVFVAGAAILLRPIQEKNQALFKNKNILMACGLLESGQRVTSEEVDKLLDEKVRVLKIDFATATLLAEGDEAKKYDERLAAKTSGQSKEIAGSPYNVGISARGKAGTAYLTKDPKTGKARIVLPIVGKGLWSVLYGFLALDQDESGEYNTVSRLLFYAHAETAGLGGEIENPLWQAKWIGKKAYVNGLPAVTIMKGDIDDTLPCEVDGISGATLTGNGVNGTVHYWLNEYKPFLDKFAEQEK